MKKIIIIFGIFVGIMVIACGGGGGDDPPSPLPVTNKAPTQPNLSSPTNNMLCIDNTVVFSWNQATDPDGDAVSYSIEVAKDQGFTQKEHSLTSASTSKTIALEKGKQYYWRVKATDSKNASSSWSSTYQFQTEGVGITNYVPFPPNLIAPAKSSVVQTSSVELQWTASDPDTSDTLMFDVYFGEDAHPSNKIASNQSASTLTVHLESSKVYYWKVVVKDDKGAEAQGGIWTFTTD